MSCSQSTDVISLLDRIAEIVNLDEPDLKIVAEHCSDLLIPKGHLFFKEGDTARYVYFIVSGKARSYYTAYEGRVITWSFHFNQRQSDLRHLFVADVRSLLTQTPGNMTFEALTDIRAIRIGQREDGLGFGHLPVLLRCVEKLRDYFFVAAYERFFNLLTLSATDRYSQLLENESYLLQLFSDKYLASYIGVEPQSLSRIRKNLQLRRAIPSVVG